LPTPCWPSLSGVAFFAKIFFAYSVDFVTTLKYIAAREGG